MKIPCSCDVIFVAAACLASVAINWRINASYASIVAGNVEAIASYAGIIAEHREAIGSQAKKIAEQGEATQRHERRLESLEEDGDGTDTSRKLQATQPFTLKNGNWETTDATSLFVFTKGIVIGELNGGCSYGNAVLSAGDSQSNCPSGDGSVTLGVGNVASGAWSVVTGGGQSSASGMYSSVTGGYSNKAEGVYSVVSGGTGNVASGYHSSVSGGEQNEASGGISSVSAGYGNKAIVVYSTVSGGLLNVASGAYASVIGGLANVASGEYSSISGGLQNVASESHSSVSGGALNIANGQYSSVSGGYNNQVLTGANFGSILGGKDHRLSSAYGSAKLQSESFTNSTEASLDVPTSVPMIPNHHPEDRIKSLEDHSPFNCTKNWCTSKKKRFLFTKGIVIGKRNRKCSYGRGTLSVDFRKGNKATNCPTGKGSVTFGRNSTTSEESKFVFGKN